MLTPYDRSAAQGSQIGLSRPPFRPVRDGRKADENNVGVFGGTVAEHAASVRGRRGKNELPRGAMPGEEEREEPDEGDKPAAQPQKVAEDDKKGKKTKAPAEKTVEDGADVAKKTTKKERKKAEPKELQPIQRNEPNILPEEEEDLELEAQRRDIETIEISSDESSAEDDDPVQSTSRGKRRTKSKPPRSRISLRPVRAPRQPNATNELDGFSRRRKIEEGIKDKNKDTIVEGHGSTKLDGIPISDDDKMDIEDGPQPAEEVELNLESRAKPKKKGPVPKDSKIAAETVEEKAERLRHAEDVKRMRDEFLLLPPPIKAKATDEFMDVDIDTEPTLPNPASEKMILFQFPPLTPMLIDPNAAVPIKQEQEPGIPIPVPSQPTDPKIKKENLNDTTTKDAAAAALAADAAKTLTAAGARLPPGFAGKLNVHKSGKVTLDWGNGAGAASMEVRWGSEVDFLQDVVLAEQEGRGYKLGQVKKKVVIVPDWGRVYE